MDDEYSQSSYMVGKVRFVLICQDETTGDERSFSPSPFDGIRRSSAAEPPQLKMDVDTGMCHCF